MLAAVAAACASAPPEPAAAPALPEADASPPADVDAEAPDGGLDAGPYRDPFAEGIPVVIPQQPRLPPSTASYEQATSKPEPLNASDDHLHLTDIQLHEPMRGVLSRCRVPPGAKVTIKTAVQAGQAIGVTVLVAMPGSSGKKSKKPTKASKEAAKAQAKAVHDLVACADHAVRLLIWPPSRRRDAFTTTF